MEQERENQSSTPEEEVLENPNKKNKKKLISNIIFLSLLTILVFVLLFNIGDFNDMKQSFLSIGSNYQYFLIAIGLTILYFVIWPFSQCIYAKSMNAEASVAESYLIGCSEHFYNGITPFAAGGQPFQIYSYTKCHVKTAKATGIILASFVTFMIVTNLFALSSLFFAKELWDGFVILNSQATIVVAVIGITINFLVLIFMFVLGTSKKLRQFLVKIVAKIANWKIFHNPKRKLLSRFGGFLVKQIPAFEEYCTNAQIAFREVFNHKRASILAIAVKIVDMAIYYMVPFFLLKSVGIEIGFEKLVLVTFTTSFAINAVVWMPTPGATGGIEFAFMFAVAAAVGRAIDGAGVALLWRLLTFYLTIIMSFITNLILEAHIRRKVKKEEAMNNV